MILGWDSAGRPRFPLRFPLSFSTVPVPATIGCGETLAISSKELFFTTDHPFQVGQQLRVAMEWPAHLNHDVPLQLIVTGHVTANDARGASLAIAHHEFRTRRTGTLPVRRPVVLQELAPNVAA